MRRSEFAQSIIEYCLVATLVAAGIILMGPYVIRAVNAHLRSWEDSVYDSVNDPLLQTANVDFPPPICDCSKKVKGACNGSGTSTTCDPITKVCTSTAVTCTDIQMFYTQVCTIINCGPTTAECKPDPSCCTNWVPTGACGVGCPPTERQNQRTCGVTGDEFSCQPDVSCLVCDPGPPPQNRPCDPGTGCAGVEICNSTGTGWDPCVPSETLCFAVTKTGKWTADLWQHDNPSSSSDPCDPWTHCSSGNVGLCGGDKMCKTSCSNCCATSTSCGSFTGYGPDAATAAANATIGLLNACSGSCGYKDSDNVSRCNGATCPSPSTCCFTGPSSGGSCGSSIAAATKYLCIGEAPATTECVLGGSCPVP